jgi:hypothetical protein
MLPPSDSIALRRMPMDPTSSVSAALRHGDHGSGGDDARQVDLGEEARCHVAPGRQTSWRWMCTHPGAQRYRHCYIAH